MVGSYGGGKATLKYSGPRDYSNMIYLGGQSAGEATVQDLIFDSIYTDKSKAGLPQAVQVLLTFARGATNSRGVPLSQPSAQPLPLSIIVAMPGAEEQVLQEQTQQTAGGIGG